MTGLLFFILATLCVIAYQVKRIYDFITRVPVQPVRAVVPREEPTNWNKPIEGFNPKKPETVLPRSEEERNARVKTVREVNENVFEFDSKF